MRFGQIQLFVNLIERQFEFDAGQKQNVGALRMNMPAPIFIHVIATEMLDENSLGIYENIISQSLNFLGEQQFAFAVEILGFGRKTLFSL